MLDSRHGLPGAFAQRVMIQRHGSPARHGEALRFQPGFQALPLPGTRLRSGIEEYRADSKSRAWIYAAIVCNGPQESAGQPDKHAAAVAGFAIGRHGAAMGESFKRLDRVGHHPVPGTTVEPDDQPEAAGIMFKIRVV